MAFQSLDSSSTRKAFLNANPQRKDTSVQKAAPARISSEREKEYPICGRYPTPDGWTIKLMKPCIEAMYIVYLTRYVTDRS